MRVLVVQNYDNTGLGQVGFALAEAGAELDLRVAHRGDSLPVDASGHDAAIILGGGQNALADADYPYIPALLDLIRDFDRRDRAMLGICLGSQLMARAFGGTNQIGGASEFGWQRVVLTEAAREDPVLGGLPRGVSDLPVARRHFLASSGRSASGVERSRRQPGISGRQGGICRPVPLRSRLRAGA